MTISGTITMGRAIPLGLRAPPSIHTPTDDSPTNPVAVSTITTTRPAGMEGGDIDGIMTTRILITTPHIGVPIPSMTTPGTILIAHDTTRI